MSTIDTVYTESGVDDLVDARQWPCWRWTFLVGLLIAEILLLSIRFDTASLAHIDTRWAVFERVSLFAKFAISFGALLLILGSGQLRPTIGRLANQVNATPFPWLAVGAHLVLMMLFYYLTEVIFEGHVQSFAVTTERIALWGCTGLAAMMCWLTAAVPATFWRIPTAHLGRWLLIALLLAVLALAAGIWAEQLWMLLSQSTFWIVERILSLCYGHVVTDLNRLIIGTDAYAVQIAPQCSGYEGIGLVVVFFGAFLAIFRHDLRFPQSLWLLPLGIAAIWVANSVRIAALIVVGTTVSAQIARGGFHSQAGWLFFNAVTLGIVALAWHSPFFAKAAAHAAPRNRKGEYPGAPYLVPFLALVGTAMLTGAFSSGGLDQLYPLRVATTGVALAYFYSSYRGRGILQWSCSLHAVAIGVAVFGIWIFLEPRGEISNDARVQQIVGFGGMSGAMTAVWIVFRAAGSVLIVPLAEELAFRGFLTRRLIADDFESVPFGRFSWFSFVVSSVAFGFLHDRWLAGTLAGMLFAWALYRRGRLMDAVLAHATANGLLTIYVLATQNLAAWS